MDKDELFDLLPNEFFKGLRKQMLLGVLPSETVEEILSPLLQDYDSLMPHLSPELRADVESILGVYWEIARKYGVRRRPSVTSVFESLWEQLQTALGDLLDAQRAPGITRSQEMTEEEIQEDLRWQLQDFATELPPGGLETFEATEPPTVTVEFSFEPEAKRYTFRCSEISRPVRLDLCGRPLLTFRPESREIHVSLEELFRIFEDNEQASFELSLHEEPSP